MKTAWELDRLAVGRGYTNSGSYKRAVKSLVSVGKDTMDYINMNSSLQEKEKREKRKKKEKNFEEVLKGKNFDAKF